MRRTGDGMFSIECLGRLKELAEGRIAAINRVDDYYLVSFQTGAEDEYRFRAFIYEDDEMLEVSAARTEDVGNLWSRPFESAEFSDREAQWSAFSQLLSTFFTFDSRIEVQANSVFVSVGCFIDERPTAVWVVSVPRASDRGKKLIAASTRVWRSGPIPAVP